MWKWGGRKRKANKEREKRPKDLPTPTPRSPVVRVLSICNQAILAPAVIELKHFLGFEHVTKDLEWKYALEIREKEKRGWGREGGRERRRTWGGELRWRRATHFELLSLSLSLVFSLSLSQSWCGR